MQNHPSKKAWHFYRRCENHLQCGRLPMQKSKWSWCLEKWSYWSKNWLVACPGREIYHALFSLLNLQYYVAQGIPDHFAIFKAQAVASKVPLDLSSEIPGTEFPACLWHHWSNLSLTLTYPGHPSSLLEASLLCNPSSYVFWSHVCCSGPRLT